MKDCKIRVPSKEVGVEVEKKLFSMGCGWGFSGKIVQGYGEGWITIRNGKINNDGKRVYAANEDLPEINYKEILMDYKEGDILIRGNVEEITIIEVLGQVFFYEDKNGASSYGTRKELDVLGYELKTDEPEIKEMTVAEIAEKLGHDVKVIK